MKFVSLLFLGPLLIVLVNGNNVTDQGRRVVCYYQSYTKIFNSTLTPENIDPSLCTHVIYINAEISNVTDEIVPNDERVALYDNDGNGIYNRIAKLKEKNPQLKVLLRVGRKSGGEQIPMTVEGRSRFIRSAVAILQTYGLDGLDFNLLMRRRQDKNPYTLLLSELRSEFDKYGFLISTYFPEFNFAFYEEDDLAEIKRCCDFVIVMTMEYVDEDENITSFFSSLTDVKSTIDLYLAKNFPPEKMLITIPTFGLISYLADVNDTKVGAAVTPRIFGENFNILTYLIYHNQLLERFKNQSENWTMHRDEVSYAPYAVNKYGHWITYDDTVSVSAKARYVVENKLGGAAILTLDMDDHTGTGGEEKFPLTRALSNIILKGVDNHS